MLHNIGIFVFLIGIKCGIGFVHIRLNAAVWAAVQLVNSYADSNIIRLVAFLIKSASDLME